MKLVDKTLKYYKDRLQLIDKLMSDDVGADVDVVLIDNFKGKKVTEFEKSFAERLSLIYEITHPVFSKCKHHDWEEKIKKLIRTTKYL